MTDSAFLVESALAVNPGRPAITLALTHDEQQALLSLVESIDTLLYLNRRDDPSILDKVRNSTAFLFRQKMKDMIRYGHSADLHATMAPLLGDDEATRVVKTLLA